ncbi:unnamed protein product [Schistosoma turkestanicum]|nr:unnamed protein product [Schistosoma turkestanicum]
MKHLGLTKREFIQYTRTTPPNALKHGAIDEVVDVLVKHYEKYEDDRIKNLAQIERRRIRNLEAEADLKQLYLRLKRPPKSQTKKSTRKSIKTSIHLINKHKPRMNLPSDSDKCKKILDSNLPAVKEEENSDHQDNKDAGETQSNRLREYDPDACLHLPLGMVRNPTPRTRSFLAAETNESLYGMASQIVYSSSEDQAQKR